MLGTLLLVVLVLAIAGSFPAWSHSRSWGYGPSGLLGVILVVLVVMAILGYVPLFGGHVAH